MDSDLDEGDALTMHDEKNDDSEADDDVTESDLTNYEDLDDDDDEDLYDVVDQDYDISDYNDPDDFYNNVYSQNENDEMSGSLFNNFEITTTTTAAAVMMQWCDR